ncbi:hypothetical protein KI387_037857, partial [Taxus chinensis]
IMTVLKRYPALSKTRSPHTAREAVQLLRDSAFTENQLQKTIVGNPNVLTQTADGRLKPKMEFLKSLGFTPQALASLISGRSRLLSFSLENSLRPRISYLKNLFGPDVNLCEVLTAAPGILSSNIEKQIKPKVEYVKNNMGISEGSKTFVYALHAVLSNGPESIDRKVKNMASLGFLDEEIREILKKSPNVLNISTKKVQGNMDFLIHTAGLERGIVVANNALLGLSLEKRLKPRYEIFISIRAKTRSKDLPRLSRMFLISEKKFHQKFVQSNPEKTESSDLTIN